MAKDVKRWLRRKDIKTTRHSHFNGDYGIKAATNHRKANLKTIQTMEGRK